MQILVRDNNVDQALRALKKKLQREGVYREMKLRRHFEKPSEKRAREKAAAVRRARKLERKRLERELADAKKALAMGGGSSSAAAGPEDIAGVAFSGQVLEGLDPKELRGLVDEAKGRLGEGIAALVAVNEGRASVAVGVTGGLIAA